MRKARATNTLRSGELSKPEASAPLTKAYQSGCEEVEGFDIRPEGLSPMKVPLLVDGKPATYRAQQYRGLYYLRNSTVGGLDVATLPTEAATLYQTLSSRLADINATTRVRAAITDTSDPQAGELYASGRWDEDQGATAGVLVDAGAPAATRTLILTKPTKIYRAFPTCWGLGGAANRDGWGLHAKRTKRYKRDTSTTIADTGASTSLGCARGGATAKKDRKWTAWLVDYVLEASDEIQVLSEVLPAGVYQFNEKVTVVGSPLMFRDAPYVFGLYEYTVSGWDKDVTVRLREDLEWTKADDGLVLFWGTGSEAEARAAWTLPAFTKLATVGDTKFWFTGRTAIFGSRRFGPAQFEADSSLFGATGGIVNGVWQMGAADAGRTIPATTPAAADPYFLKIDGGVTWFEPVPQGILIGSQSAEFILTDPQVAPAAGGAALQRITGIGSPGLPGGRDGDILKVSAVLAGDVYYISHHGLTTIDFSNEGQTYLPRTLEFKGRRFGGRCTSLAASIEEACLYLSFVDGSVWKVWPSLGAVAKVPLELGDKTLLGVFERDGRVSLLVLSGSDRLVYPADAAVARSCYLRTTAFGRAPGTRTQIRQVSITGVGLMAGEVGVGGRWSPLLLTAAQQDEGMTGTASWRVSDRPAREGEGKVVEFRWNLADSDISDPGILEAITVEMEV